MKLQQLRHLNAVARNNLNVSAAAERLHTSQPGVGKQLRRLEDELGLSLFRRSGRSLTAMTEAGAQVLAHARRVLREVENVRSLVADPRDGEEGTLIEYFVPGQTGKITTEVM